MVVGTGSPKNLDFVGRRGTSTPTGGGWENLPMTERLRQTFERGLTRVELDLADAYNKKITPGNIPDAQRRISKQIAAEYGANFSVHAPYQVDIASQSWAQRTEAAEIMRQSIKYAKDMGAKMVTFHPTANLSGASFRDPFSLQDTPVQAHFLLRTKKEFDYWCGQHNITKDSPIYNKMREEAGVMFNAQAMQFTQHYAAAAPIYAKEFGQVGARFDGMAAVAEQLDRGVTDKEKLRQAFLAAASSYANSSDEHVQAGGQRIREQFNQNPDAFIEEAKARREEARDTLAILRQNKDPDAQKFKTEADWIRNAKMDKWQMATMAKGGRINRDGSTVQDSQPYDGIGNPETDLNLPSESQFSSRAEYENYIRNAPNSIEFRKRAALRNNFAEAMTKDRQIDLGNEDPVATAQWIQNMKDTFKDVFRNKDVQRDILEGKIILSVENLWGVNPEKGVTEAAGYFNKAEHMVMAVQALKDVARECGLPPDVVERQIKMTFDTEHAAIGSQTDPTKFIEELKKQGKEDIVGHVHLVGGGSTASIFGHKGFGSIEDDVARKNPALLQKLVELGVPMTIEPGSGGIKDVEAGLETLMLGVPLEALQAATGKPGSPEAELVLKLGYSGVPMPAYGAGLPGMDSKGYFAAFAAQGNMQVLAGKSLYSFGPSLAQPFRATYGAVASPSLYQGGISHQAPGTNIWGGSQPMLYSMRPKE